MRKRQYIHFPVCLGQEKGLISQQKTYSLDPVQNFVLLRIVTNIEVPRLGSLLEPPSLVCKQLNMHLSRDESCLVHLYSPRWRLQSPLLSGSSRFMCQAKIMPEERDSILDCQKKCCCTDQLILQGAVPTVGPTGGCSHAARAFLPSSAEM